MEVDLSQLPHEVRRKMDDIFRNDFDLKLLKAVEAQKRTAQLRRDNVRWNTDMKPELEINPVIDSFWRRVYGHNYTENPDLMKFLARRNEEIRVNARSPKIQVGYQGQTPNTKHPTRKGRTGCVFGRGTLELAR